MSRSGDKQEVLKLAWPLSIGMLSFTLMGVVDTLMMGRVNTFAQAGVGLGATVILLVLHFFQGLSYGPQSLVAASDGNGNRSRVELAGGAGIIIGLVAGLVGTLVLLVIHVPIFSFAVKDPEVAAAASQYLLIRLIGTPLRIVGLGFLAAIQGLGDTKTPMRVGLLANGLNAVFDVILIFGVGPIPAMGAAGAAWATVASSIIMAALYARRYWVLLGRPKLPTVEVLTSSLKVGLPSGMEGLSSVGAYAVVCLLLARSGAAHLAASEIVVQIISFSFLPGFGIGQGGGILIGRYLGAGNLEAAHRSLVSARILAVGLMSIFALGFATVGGFVVALFTMDPMVAEIGATLMLFAAVFQVLDATFTVNYCAMQAVGDTRFSLIVSTVMSWALQVPLTLIFSLWMGFGAPGAWAAFTLQLLILTLITGRRVSGIRSGKIGRKDLLLGQPAQAAIAAE